MNKSIIAVIDIGSNSIRLQISKILDKTYKIIEEYKETARIGDNVYKTGIFSQEAIETLTQTLSRIKTIMNNNHVLKYRAVATAPFREASNAKKVVQIIKKQLGINIEIIDGTEEARLIYVATSAYFELNNSNTLLIDMGGGSTEFSYASYGRLHFSESTSLGCSKLTYNFFKNDPVKTDEIRILKQEIKETTANFLPLYSVNKIIFSGGTLNNISFIYNKRKNLSDSAVKFVDAVFLKHFVNEVSGKNVAERLKINGVEPARADIILSAALMAQVMVKKYNLDGFYTLSGGLRAGLTIDLMNKLGHTLLFQHNNEVELRYSRLVETGKKYYFEETHALQVTLLAKNIFNSLKNYLKLSNNDWLLLEAAAILHDIGQYISYVKHQKHSYYLIMNTELIGYNDAELNIIANIARYHRRGIPKNKHLNYKKLTSKEKEKVLKLTAILRIADGLDRSHSSLIKDINIQVTNKSIIFKISSDEDISMEIGGFNKKKDLLEEITNKEVNIQ